MEVWKDVPGYEDSHQVSSLGRVKTKDRYIVRSDGVVQHRKSKMMVPQRDIDGYLQCKLCRNGWYATKRIHRLVAEAFLKNPLNLPEVNHIDSNRQNNRVENIEWISRIDNVRQSINEGRHISTRDLSGENNPNYGNDALRKKYSKHPEKARKAASRPGAQNGRARKVTLFDGEMRKIGDFSYLGECARYIKERDSLSTTINSLITGISSAIKTGKKYKGYYFR